MDILVDMVFGSHLYGTNSETSDRDYKGVFMPTREQILLQRIPHSINESTKKVTSVE
jgi:predicted nucleotidyltransferase